MTPLTISMPPALQSWVDARLAEGRYADAADYFRDLVRRDQERLAQLGGGRAELHALIEEGFASAIIDREPEDILEEILAEDPDLRA